MNPPFARAAWLASLTFTLAFVFSNVAKAQTNDTDDKQQEEEPLKVEPSDKDGKDTAQPEKTPPSTKAPATRQAVPMRSNWMTTGGYDPSLAVIREPSQGRPIFITPGETFYFVMKLASQIKGDVSFVLQHSLEPGNRYKLKPTTPPSYMNDEYCSLVLMVNASVPPGLYDLEVKTPDASYYSRHSVKVIDRFKDKFRFIHLSNMNVGELTAPDFDEMLPREINVLAPEFIIATGDYTEWARVRDDASSWSRVLKFFQKFNAPVFMLCGLHDHEASFTTLVASKPIGTIDYGKYHGLLLLDHPGNPIDQDYSQIQWVEADLKQHRNMRMNFIATNSDELGLLDVWREAGKLESFLKQHKVKMYIAGGACDWDYREFGDKLKGLEDFQFIRTHQSSTCLLDKSSGVSHYRDIEIDGDKISFVYPDDNATSKLQNSIPTGRLRTFFDGKNDGSAPRIGVTVQNSLNQSFDDCRVWLRVAKRGSSEPIVAPGKLIRALDVGTHWACEVAFNLPNKGAVKLVASTNPDEIPSAVPVTAAIDGPSTWSFTSKDSNIGVSYFDSPTHVNLKLSNTSNASITCWPVLRVNGNQINPDRSAVPRMPVTIEAGKTVTLPLALNLRRVSPGPQKLQVYFLEDPLSRLQTFDVELARQEVVSSVNEEATPGADTPAEQ